MSAPAQRRIIFEHIHKSAGYLLLALTVLALCTGLYAADAPRWMPVALGAWWIIMAGVFVALQRAGRCIDTYQAIWGLDPELPGNRRRPIGLGIVRRPVTDFEHDPEKWKPVFGKDHAP